MGQHLNKLFRLAKIVVLTAAISQSLAELTGRNGGHAFAGDLNGENASGSNGGNGGGYLAGGSAGRGTGGAGDGGGGIGDASGTGGAGGGSGGAFSTSSMTILGGVGGRGNGGTDGGGGWGVSGNVGSGSGGDGGIGSGSSSGGGFGGGGGGGGGFGIRVGTGANVEVVSNLAGGAGGAGTLSGGGGGGGSGIRADDSSIVKIDRTASVSGGAGGRGLGGGGGGSGIRASNATLTIDGTVIGGNGGGGPSGSGFGGAGVRADNSIVTISGTVVGGNFAGTGQGAGQGVVGSGLTVVLKGGASIAGGVDMLGMPQAAAIAFTGGTNVLELQAGTGGQMPVLIGGITHATGGDTLRLGGSNAGTLDASSTYGNIYTGFSSLEKTGSSTWTLMGESGSAADWTISGGVLSVTSDRNLGTGTLTFDGGTLRTTGSQYTRSNGVILNGGGGTIEVVNGVSTTLSGTMSGVGALTKAGNGVLLLTAANTYSGGTNLNGGSIIIGNDRSLGTGGVSVNASSGLYNQQDVTIVNPITIARGAALSVGNTRAITLDGPISGSGDFVQWGSGTVALTGANSYTGRTQVLGKVLELRGAGALSALSAVSLSAIGAVLDISAADGARTIAVLDGIAGTTVALGNNSLTLGDGIDRTFAGGITGSGMVTKTGTGKTTLTGANSYTGGTTIGAGTLAIGVGGSLSATGKVNLSGTGAALDISNAQGQQTIGGLSGVVGTNVSLGGNTLVFGDASSTIFAGIITGTGGVVKSSAGTTALTGANTYTGGTTIIRGNVVLGPGGSLNRAGVVQLAFAGAGFDISAAGDQTIGTLTGVSGTTVSVGNNVLTFGDATDRSFGGVIFGSGGMNKTGNGTTALYGENTAGLSFAGTANVTGGKLAVNGVFGNLDSVGGLNQASVNVSNTGVLGGTGTIAGRVTIGPGGTLSAGNSPGTLTVNGDVALGAGSKSLFELGAPNAYASAANDLVHVGGGLSVDNGATLALQTTSGGQIASGFYTLFDVVGTTTGRFGTVTNGGLSATSDIRQIVTNGGVSPSQFQALVANGSQVVQFWDGNGAANDGVVSGGAGTWTNIASNWATLGGTLNSTWQAEVGVFAGASGGTVTVAGTQSFQGLQFSTNGYTLTGGSLTLSGNPFVGSNGRSFVTVDRGISATIGSTLTGAGVLAKLGAGMLTLTGVNTYTGGTDIAGGMLAVGADANLGAASGGIAFRGGRLTVTGTAYSGTSRAVTIAGGSSGIVDIADASNSFTLSGIVSGAGDLVKNGLGTLALTGANTYQGNTVVLAGTLVGTASSIRGNIATGGTVVFDQTGDATYSGVISNSATVEGSMVKRGSGVLALSGPSFLAWSVDAGGLVAASDRFSGDLAIGSGAAFTFDQSYAGSYAGKLTGAGSLDFRGGGAVQLTGDSAGFSGLTTVANGMLSVNGKLGGSALVDTGGRLQGVGTLGSGAGSIVTIASGGTLAPGNSIGTLSINGNLVMNAGSRFEVEVAPGGTTSDRVAVSGAATLLGGTVAHVGMTGTYNPRSTYTILTADGGVSGRFSGVTSSFAFLNAALGYSATAVTLSLQRNDIGFKDAGVTRNQRATAAALDTLGFGNALYDKVVQLDAKTAQTAFDQLSGEIHASAFTALVEDSRFIRNAANDRIRAAFGDVGASSAPVMSYGPDGKPLTVAADDAGPVFWSSAYGSWGRTSSDGNAAALDRSTGGLLMGADAAVFDTWRFGVLGGYSHSSVQANARASSASIDSYHAGLYAGTQWGALSFRSGLAYSFHDVDTSRRVGFTGFADRLSGSYHAGTVQAFGEFGYGIDTTIGRIEPFANLAYVNVHTDGFGERGGAAALRSAANDNGVTFTTLGLRGDNALAFGAVKARLTGMLGWRHAFGDTTPEITHAFAGSDAFTVAGAPIARDALAIEAGLNFDFTPNATLGFSYQGQIANHAQDHGLKASLAVKF